MRRLSKPFGLSVFALLALMGSAVFFFNKPFIFDTDTKSYLTQQKLESYAEYIQVDRFNLEGSLQSETSSVHITQYQHSDEIIFKQPITTIYQQNQNWSITAHKGVYFPSKSTLNLFNQVIIKNLANNMTLKTSKLSYDIARKKIQTSEMVTINSKQGTLTATGMSLDIDQETLELHKGIHTQYEN